MILYYDGVTTTVNTSGYLGTNLADIQFSLVYIMRTYNNNRPATAPAITDIKYRGDVPDIRICMADGSSYNLPFYGTTARELWNSGEEAVTFLAYEMGIIRCDDE